METEARARIARRLRRQATACRLLGSPLYEGLLERAAEDAEAGGPVWRALEGHDLDPAGSALALRFMGALHRLVLEGAAPALAAHYPTSSGASARVEDAWPAFLEVVESRRAPIRSLLGRTVQTNEVGRCAALAGGFLRVARELGFPLRLLEVGASAGLNLRWDLYRYEARGVTWGPAGSPVRLCDFATPPVPPFGGKVDVIERRGCDVAPLDPASDADRLTLRSYVWADQLHRRRLLDAALKVAADHPVPVERASADDWLARQLSRPVPGVATVVFHSIVVQYLSDEARSSLDDALRRAAHAATPDAPLAHLAMEPGGEEADVHLELWPGGRRRLIARAGYHGSPVRWLAQ